MSHEEGESGLAIPWLQLRYFEHQFVRAFRDHVDGVRPRQVAGRRPEDLAGNQPECGD